ncbi:hypothetical protein LAZ67_X002584 [Cordylochernes scorpioides]|uniref:ATP-dependent DNA helicase n=1 Tax=Cordylochernes scorpioides TaxID=51811 RepID=A0ABY6LTX6_9ARAC|nr:hypothetical protein LAZ67_X002584 [Cordylochernes scorpioides]
MFQLVVAFNVMVVIQAWDPMVRSAVPALVFSPEGRPLLLATVSNPAVVAENPRCDRFTRDVCLEDAEYPSLKPHMENMKQFINFHRIQNKASKTKMYTRELLAKFSRKKMGCQPRQVSSYVLVRSGADPVPWNSVYFSTSRGSGFCWDDIEGSAPDTIGLVAVECSKVILSESTSRRVNPYTSAYRQMHQVELAEEHRARIENRQMCQVQMLIRQNHCRDLRRYNAPSVSEVAAIFVDQDGHVPSNRDIAVFPHDCGLVRISPLNPNCDPMTYPLLFPAGDPGWAIGILHEENMRTSTRNHVTMLQFYSYRLAIRSGFSPIHYGRRLFQQYVVDAYVKTEGNRLNYIRQNQSLLRVELYQGLMDYIHELEHSRGVRIGRIFILPSSFPGSSRAMQQNYQDAMAIVRKFGRPDLFVTFTCNPRWTDIVENLLPNQNPSDRPDLVARVFNLKLQQLLHEIVSQHVLGVVIARVHVVEFQKRGLPHAHMLFMLREEDKPRDRDAIDRLVCAEIPSPTMQVQLYDMVRKHMIHGPCGNFNLHSPCMSDGKCTKDFPKSFLQLTEANNNGYPRYRRRDDGQTFVVGTHEVDNRWVVPYNPYLLVRFIAHINVEVCASVKSVKYLFKYVYKGHDRAEVEVSVGELDMESRAHDEIKNFLDARYVSAPEAMWRMFEYRLHAHSHTICRLAVHLPNFQSVYFVEGSEEQALENASRRRTTLTAWFQLNCVNVSARSLLYGDIPSAYVFRQNQWSARVRGGALCIGRMCSVNPKDSERYHLRLLLLHVAGAQSFEDLRTVDDIVCSTFKEAAQRRGLLADDSEWDACLAEAALFQMPCQLRQLFATILIYNNPTDPVSLWTKYKGYLSEDFSSATSDAAAEQMTLRELEFQLRENRLSCHHYGLPAPLTPLLDSGEDHLDVNAELQIGTEMYRSLTPDQKSIVDTIVDSLNVNSRCFFIDGPGGTGKTYLYNTLIHCVRAVGKIVIPLASTGIAATLLSGGQTVHSRFKLPIPLLENSVAAISANSSEAELIRRSSLIIWDEAPMAHYRALEIVDRLLKDIMHCDLAFGGKVVVLGGDFRQVLPVVPRASRAEIVAACIKQSKLWPLFVILRLTQNMRAGIDAQSFSQWLLKVGDGDLPTDQQGLISLPESCIFHGVDLVQEIFGSSYGDITALSQSVILTPKNTDSLEINEKVLDRLPNRSQCFLSVDSVECENVEEQNNYPTEFLNSLTPTGMPPHRLNLKIGAIVMLLRNLNPKQGLCNGTRMVIQRMRSHVLEAQILTGTKVGQTVLVPKISLAPSDTNLPFILKRRQFPLRQKYYGLRPYHVENTGSRPITEVKQRRARDHVVSDAQKQTASIHRVALNVDVCDVIDTCIGCAEASRADTMTSGVVIRRVWYMKGIDSNIEELTRECRVCQESASMPLATISEWTWPEKPWHRLHLDLADNGRQFVSGEFEQFTKMNGIRHTKTSPYNPSTNGLAERYEIEFKNLLRKNNGKDDLETNLQRLLFAHRAFSQTVIKEFPRGTANEEKFKIKILEFNTKMGNPREVFHEAVRRQKQFTTGCEVYFRNYATGPKRILYQRNRRSRVLRLREVWIEDTSSQQIYIRYIGNDSVRSNYLNSNLYINPPTDSKLTTLRS